MVLFFVLTWLGVAVLLALLLSDARSAAGRKAESDARAAAGLLEEVQGLLRGGCPETANAFKAIGYHEALRHLRGEMDLREAIALTQRSTRRYAKRQWTWFRKEEGVTWFTVDPSGPERFSEPLAHAAMALGRG